MDISPIATSWRRPGASARASGHRHEPRGRVGVGAADVARLGAHVLSCPNVLLQARLLAGAWPSIDIVTYTSDDNDRESVHNLFVGRAAHNGCRGGVAC